MKRTRKFWPVTLSFFLCAMCIVPFIYVLITSFQNAQGDFTLRYYYEVFVGGSQYLFRFWKSIGLSLCIAIGQVAVSALAGYSFAKYQFPGKHILFFVLMILMILPLQVTLMPNYIVLEKVNILNTYASLALPAIILPLGTFILTQSFRAIPNSVIEAARLDGCKLPGLLLRVVMPMSQNALVCVFLLSFLDAWNMVEQPIVYLKSGYDYPLSVFLTRMDGQNLGVLCTCGVLASLPVVLLFLYYDQKLTEGVTMTQL